MAEYSIPVYSDQDLSPRAIETIRAIIDSAYPEHTIKFHPWNGNRMQKVLVFGRGPEGDHNRAEFIYTYSIAQVMSKANTASVLAAAIRQFITEPTKPEFMFYGEDISTEHWGYSQAIGARLKRYLTPDAPMAIDIETNGNLSQEDTTDTVGIISVAFYQPGCGGPIVIRNEWDSFGYTPPLDDEQVAALAEFMPTCTKAIYHNGKFDIRVLNRVLGVKLTNWFDTMLAHHVLNIAAGDHKLKPCARRYLGAPDWETGLTKYLKQGGHYELIPTDKLTEYNGWDVYWTYQLWLFLAPQIESDEDNQKAFYLEMQAAHFLLDVEVYGIPMDEAYLGEFGYLLSKDIEAELSFLREHTGNLKFNPGSPIQVKRWLAEQGVNVRKTNEATLQELIDNDGTAAHVSVFCEAMLNFRGYSKQKGTYVEGWKKRMRNGRVHPTYLVHGTSTGRLSSTNPNAQNVPRDKTVRKIVRTLG